MAGLLCFLFGHDPVYIGKEEITSKLREGIEVPEGYVVQCTYCEKQFVWPAKTCCDKFGCDFVPHEVLHYQQYETVMGKRHDLGAATRRFWACSRCGDIKKDKDNEMLEGKWVIEEGQFVLYRK